MHILSLRSLAAALLAAVLALPAVAQSTVASAADAQTSYVGYTNGVLDRNKAASLSNDGLEGQAICLTKAKAQALKGATITGLSVGVGTSRMEPFTVFVTKELGGTPLYEKSYTYAEVRKLVSTSVMKDIPFDRPVTIDGDALYIGYTAKPTMTGYNPLQFDYASVLLPGLGFARVDGQWQDIASLNVGSPLLRFILENAPDVADVQVKPFSATDYYRAGNNFKVTPEIFNIGPSTVTSLEVTTSVNGGAEQTRTIDNLNVPSGSVYNLELTDLDASQPGNAEVSVAVNKVNGQADGDPSDNTTSSSAYIYPENMQHRFLVEAFTGQTCGNCPRGHKEIKSFISKDPESFIEVAHHAGYELDYFTMTEDAQYTWFYDSRTFAPAAMLDRTPYSLGLTSPLYGNGNVGIDTDLDRTYAVRRNVQPYVSVDLTNEYDKATRHCKVTVSVHTYVVPSNEIHTLNLWLTQDSIVSFQNGATQDYVHNHAFRVSLTGNWGTEIELKAGETVTKTFEYEMPDSITNTVYETNDNHNTKKAFATDPANMHWVAFVGDVTNSKTTCTVWNCNEIAVNENGTTSGIEAVTTTPAAEAQALVSGSHVSVSGSYRQARVYNLSGISVATLTGDASVTLPAGVYLVKIDAQPAQKVLVR